MCGDVEILYFIWHVIGSSGQLVELYVQDCFDICTSPPAPRVIPSLTPFSFEEGRCLVDRLILPGLRELTVRDIKVRSFKLRGCPCA